MRNYAEKTIISLMKVVGIIIGVAFGLFLFAPLITFLNYVIINIADKLY